MKKLVILTCMLFLTVSCGDKPGAKSSFKIISSNMSDPQVTFPGGVLVMGRHTDGSQSFVLPWTPSLELVLKKGSWDFATIGWEGPNPIEGNQKCAFAKADVNSDVFAVEFNMNYQNCLHGSASDGSRFTSPLFYYASGGNYLGFKTLTVNSCPNLASDCNDVTMAPVNTFKVVIPVNLVGVQVLSGLTKGLSTQCVVTNNLGESNVTPPYGGPRGFITTNIITFNSQADCESGYRINDYSFPHGFGKPLDRPYVLGDTTYDTKRGAVSINPYATNSILALTPLVFKGEHSNNAAYPLSPATNDIYKYTGTSGLIAVSPGSYIWFDGSGWVPISDNRSVKLILEN